MLPSDAILLGAPLIGLSSAKDCTLEARCSDLHTAITRLQTIFAHDALILLRFSFSALDFYIPSNVHLVAVIFWAPMTTFSERVSQLFVTPTLATFSGFKPAFQFGRAGWESDVPHRWAFLPF